MTTPAPIADASGSLSARERLQAAGLRVTTPRITVVNVVDRHPHSGADAIFREVRETLAGTSVQAVYNILGDLTRAGLLRRIQPAGSAALYERRVGDNHHHLVCRRCGAVDDVDCAVGEAPCLSPSHSHGFAIDEAEVTFWGLCPACSAASLPTQ